MFFTSLFCRQERRVYYLHRYKARKFPERCMASTADGMDQHSTNIPNLKPISKAMFALTTVGTHLVSAIVHSGQSPHGKEVYGSFDFYQFPHDSNLTMTVLLDTLVYWTNDYLLPPILYLQFHNCVRENKNRYMFALLTLLIEEKIFEKVCVSLSGNYFICHAANGSNSLYSSSHTFKMSDMQVKILINTD